MTRHRRNHLAAAAFVAGTGFTLLGGFSAAGAAPVAGNPSCADVLPGSTEFKIDSNPASGTHNGPDGLVVTITNNGDGTFTWSSNQPIDALIVKGGPNADVTIYPGGATSGSGSSLVNPENQQRFGISHVSFCNGPDQPTTTTTAPPTTTTLPPSTTLPPPPPEQPPVVPETPTPEPAPEAAPVVEEQVLSQNEVTEVAGVQQERAALARTGTSTGLLTATGLGLLTAGTVLVRRTRATA